MIKIFPEIPRWKFDIDEVSAGVYEIVGTDDEGHSISLTGTDPEDLIMKCKKSASDLSRQE